jgi:hypothetical protein
MLDMQLQEDCDLFPKSYNLVSVSLTVSVIFGKPYNLSSVSLCGIVSVSLCASR